MLQKTNAVAVRTIGIDTGKNTLHLIGLDQQGTIVLREKLARGRIGRRLANASLRQVWRRTMSPASCSRSVMM